jgi:hypothetical protein
MEDWDDALVVETDSSPNTLGQLACRRRNAD